LISYLQNEGGERQLSKKDACTSSPVIKEQLGVQNIEDLEKIKEDSAESFIDPNNQLGMILQNPVSSNNGGGDDLGR